jgi:hypothetical protein
MKISTPLKIGALTLLTTFMSQARAQTIYGTIGSTVLASFNAATPGTITSTVSITGITTGQTIEGLDFRPNTGQLYAFGYNSAGNLYQVYTINRMSGVATAINTATTIALGNGPIGFDFNPTVDRIRVVSANGGNFRLHPGTGLIAATDGTLSYVAGDPNAAASPKIVTAGYTNSYIGAATTALYNYDNSLNVVTLQNPPNNGSLITVGASGITTSTTAPMVDIDIFYDNMTSTNKAYLLANSAGSAMTDQLYALNVGTGAATLIGAIGAVNPVSNIAVMIDRTTPAMVGQMAYGLSGTNLISFDTQNPGYIRELNPITGITAGQNLVGMDFRPATGTLYALGFNGTTNDAQLYTINTNSAIATAVNATPVSISIGTVNTGFDFNPTVDKIRVVSNNDMNYRLDPLTGMITATDANVNFAAGDLNAGANPNVGTVAYINSINTATATTLYNYDEVLNILTNQNPPNNGTLNTIGTSGITVNSADPSIDMDIFYDVATMTNKAFLAANVNTDMNDNLYSVNLSTGTTTLIGKIGFGIPVRDIAVQSFTVLATGISQNGTASAADLAKIYPNPLSETAIINLKKDTSAKISVMDMTGKQLVIVTASEVKHGETIITWNTSNLEKGIYFVQIVGTDGHRQVIKVLK